ncbi:MAG: fibronectin type III domain-containing protein [Chitinophagaceae bacterium]|nr:fibronectin type III domain-containing protein [Chitinophagaceae bacterium]
MKKFNIITLFILLFSANVIAQFSTDWIKPADSYQKIGVMMTKDNLDNAIATGYWTSNNIFTRKYNKFGVLQWEAVSTSGIASNYERPLWVSTDNNNNVIVAGYRYAGTSTPNAVVVLKYSPDGVQLWKQVVTPVNYLAGMSLRCDVDINGNVYVGACGVGALPGFALIKFDTNGNILFTQHSAANAPAYFESMRVKGNKIVMSASGGDPNISVIAVWDTTGTFLWSNGVQGRGGRDVEIDDAGNMYLLTGYFNQVTATSQMDIELFKFDASGTQLWKKDFDFGGGADFSSRFIYVAGKLSIIGQSQSLDSWITFQVNTDGTMLWNKAYNGAPGFEEAPYFIAAKANGEVFVTGKGGPNVDPNNVPSLRMITLKYSNTGVQTWVDSTNYYNGWGYACTLASDGSLFALSGTNMTVYHFLDHTGSGSCNIPTGLNVANIANTLATFSWAPVSGATLYHLRYRPTTVSAWTVVSYDLTTMNIFGLYPGTTYEYAIEAICANGPSGYSATQTFTTTGTAICTSVGQSQVQEYLYQVWVGGVNHISGRDNGYGDFTNVVMSFTRNQNVQGYLSGLVPYPEDEYYSIYIDYNHNNDFTDAGEEVVALYTDFTGLISFNFTVPSNAPLGTARMRVIMSHDSPPTPCGVYARGETQDYTVLIKDTSTVPPPIPIGLNATNITTASARIFWTPDSTAASYNLRYKKITESTWTIAPLNDTTINLPGLSSITDYNYAVEAVGSVGNSGYTATQTFTTLGGPLPISGVDITAKRRGSNVLVSWTTQSEQNSSTFEIERSIDGINFSKIGQVQATGNSTSQRNYQFTDVNVAKSMLYYRLKMINTDASFKLSPVRIVAKTDANMQEFQLYPNPAISYVNIALADAAAKDLQLQITNQMGQIVKTISISKGTLLKKLDISELPKGVYAVIVTGNETVQVKKLLIQ